MGASASPGPWGGRMAVNPKRQAQVSTLWMAADVYTLSSAYTPLHLSALVCIQAT